MGALTYSEQRLIGACLLGGLLLIALTCALVHAWHKTRAKLQLPPLRCGIPHCAVCDPTPPTLHQIELARRYLPGGES